MICKTHPKRIGLLPLSVALAAVSVAGKKATRLVRTEGRAEGQKRLTVSPQDRDLLWLRKWSIGTRGYAAIVSRTMGGRFRLHRLIGERIKGAPLTERDIMDHINHNKRDNRRENLRITDKAGNAQNTTHGRFRGAYWHRGNRSWVAAVKTRGITHCLGYFKSREVAARTAAAKRAELGFLTNKR